jgi:hypothetical protein
MHLGKIIMKCKEFSLALLSSLFATSTLLSAQANTTTSPDDTTTVPLALNFYKTTTEVVSAHGEFLYWTVRESNLDYALRMNGPAWGPTESFAQGSYKTTKFNWTPGLRVALSYYNAPKYWELKTEYTWLNPHGSDTAYKPNEDDEFLVGTWPQIFTDPMRKARSNIHFNYNAADLQATRVFHPNPHFRFRLIGGIAGTWMKQDWNIKYFDTMHNQTRIKNKWDYWGAGVRGGISMDWYLDFASMYLTGKATTAVLLGRYHNHSLQTTTFSPNGKHNPSIPLRNAYYEDTRVAYNVQVLLGPSWQKNTHKYRFEVFAGYEINAWFNVQEVFRSTANSPSLAKETLINTGSLSLDGLTARVTIDF